jgi:hypothetical protein
VVLRAFACMCRRGEILLRLRLLQPWQERTGFGEEERRVAARQVAVLVESGEEDLKRAEAERRNG